MTRGEYASVVEMSRRPHVTREMPDGRVQVYRVDGGLACPWYDGGCTVYPVRPGVCRAYGCFRKAGEAWTMEGHLARIRGSRGVQRVQARMLEAAEAWTATRPLNRDDD